MQTINYDFSNLETIMFNFKSDQSSSRLGQIKSELNKFFKDSQCKEVIYTNNTDKLFFGMCVMPVIDSENIVELVTSNEKTRITEYYLEIDSKLLSPTLSLSARELVAVLLHEIGHIVNDASPIEDTKNAINTYLAKNNEHLILTDSIQYKELLAYAIKDSIRKICSVFVNKDEEMLADEFVIRCGYGPELESACKKIVKNSGRINRDVDNKLIVMQWVLRVYKDVRIRRISAIHTLNKGKNMTASTLEKREMDNVIRRLKQIDDDSLIQESAQVFKKANEAYKNMKYKGMRSLEDDLYEYSLRAKNVDEQEEALMIIRQINTRICIIDDFIKTEKLSETERDRWFDLLDKYQTLRDDISKKTTYTDKYYGLFVQLPTVKSRYEV